MDNRNLLIITIILLVGIIVILMMGMDQDNLGEKAADNIVEFSEEIRDEVDDATVN